MIENYYVKVNEYSFVITPPEEGDYEWKDQGATGLHADLSVIFRSEQHGPAINKLWGSDAVYGYDDIAPGEDAYVVFVKYETGDTFGSHEDWCIPAIKADVKEAYKALAKVNNAGEKDYQCPWVGYFETLQSVEVIPMKMMP